MNLKHIILCLTGLYVSILTLNAQATPSTGYTEAEIDTLAQTAMETFQIPGMSVGIIKDGQIIHLKGYGVRDISKSEKINPQTLFSIASTSKAFTATALAMLVEDGKIKWEDKVTDYIPEFQMHDAWVTREFTIRDLMIHNSGLGKGAGDLMFWPSTDFTRAEIIKNLRHLKPASSFRSKYNYGNLMYIVAGEIVPVVTGLSLEDFTDRRILKPLGMKHCAANRKRLKRHKNIAAPHMVLNGELINVDRMKPLHEKLQIAGPGGIECSAESLLKWLDMNLNAGQKPNGQALLSQRSHAALLRPHITRTPSKLERKWFNTHFKNYGLGWSILDAHGYKWVAHAGGLHGIQSYVGLLPEKNVGIVVLTNQQSGAGLRAVFYGLMESYLSNERPDWVARFKTLQDAQKPTPHLDLDNQTFVPKKPLQNYIGAYHDVWFGEVRISKADEGLYFSAQRSPRLKGKLIPYKDNIFIAKWDDRTLEADAYVHFFNDIESMPNGFLMKPVSPATDVSFDYGDLSFRRTQ